MVHQLECMKLPIRKILDEGLSCSVILIMQISETLIQGSIIVEIIDPVLK